MSLTTSLAKKYAIEHLTLPRPHFELRYHYKNNNKEKVRLTILNLNNTPTLLAINLDDYHPNIVGEVLGVDIQDPKVITIPKTLQIKKKYNSQIDTYYHYDAQYLSPVFRSSANLN